MDDEVIDDKEQEVEVSEISDEELTGDDTDSETNSVDVEDMIDKIIDDNNVGAKADFEALIASKLDDLLNARKHEIAQSLYADKEEDSNEQEEVVDTADTEEE